MHIWHTMILYVLYWVFRLEQTCNKHTQQQPPASFQRSLEQYLEDDDASASPQTKQQQRADIKSVPVAPLQDLIGDFGDLTVEKVRLCVIQIMAMWYRVYIPCRFLFISGIYSMPNSGYMTVGKLRGLVCCSS
jgi:hypothetical protein